MASGVLYCEKLFASTYLEEIFRKNYALLQDLYTELLMKKKEQKIQALAPFENLAKNYQMIDLIEKNLSSPHIYTNYSPQQQSQRLGRGSIQHIIKNAKGVLQVVQNLRAQQKQIQQVRVNAILAQQKLEQQQEVIRNYQKKFSERTKAILQENRVLKQNQDKLRRVMAENEDALRIQLEEVRRECQQVKLRLNDQQNENKKLMLAISELQEQLKAQTQINNRLLSLTDRDDRQKNLKERLNQLQDARRKFKKVNVSATIARRQQSSLEWLSTNDISALSEIISFLTPKEAMNLSSTNRQMRLFILKSKQCTIAIAKSVSSLKNRKINYYHQHVIYFQERYNKIPEQVLQLAYLKYHILKLNVGQDIMPILNSSATIFQGKFSQVQELYAGLPSDPLPLIDVRISPSQAELLEVDPSIIEDYKTERSLEREKLKKLFETMYGKINNTFQLYRADVQSSKLFIENILKHFSKVFVLSKSLYLQAQQIQQLNWFLIQQLNSWDRMQINKNLQLEDMRAQLEAEKKLRLFFTDKSIKSEQKALLQQNLKLTIQLKYAKLTDLMNVTCSQKDELSKKSQALSSSNQALSNQAKETKRRYDLILEKYNKITEELTVVKQTIIKMNLV